ncbi:Uncharacterised protein [Nocardia farcinica]|uniref:hypothetical protein n=1 Tax=Nocardia farcinica TaxID=37329 RepID=UPI000DFA8AB0|nr:hypothetical protein [Nocardia farcinica]SUE29563.1 Uncharacterised protein [Nocardia farcinica]
MDDQEFFDQLYQLWSKTNSVGEGYWSAREDESFPGCYEVVSDVGYGTRFIASFMTEDVADFLAVVHTALPDIVRRFNEMADEADRFLTERDEQINRVLALEIENDVLRAQLEAKS